MKTLRVEKPRTLTDYINIIDDIRKASNCNLWYRGCGQSAYKLIPSLYRHEKVKKIEELIDLEYKLMTRFRQRSIPFHDKSLDKDWEALFLMQHYGIPTRLLDWTENPFIALFFSGLYAKTEFIKGNKKATSPSAVWIINPELWNKHALRNISYSGEILSTNDDQIKSYQPTPKYTTMNEKPVALHGVHNSERIVAQRGVFMLFGSSTLPLETQYEKDGFPFSCLTKIVINRSVLLNLHESLVEKGITESVVFPDLEGLAKEIRRTFKFDY